MNAARARELIIELSTDDEFPHMAQTALWIVRREIDDISDRDLIDIANIAADVWRGHADSRELVRAVMIEGKRRAVAARAAAEGRQPQ